MESKKEETIIILGAPRSGTSLTSAIIQILGIDMGDISPSVKSNPKGDWEDIDFMRLNKKILLTTKKDYISGDIPSEEEIVNQKHNFDKEIRELVEEKNKKMCWGWKDPHTILTLSLFLPYIRNPKIITIFRKQEDTANSYKKLLGDKIDIKKSLALVKVYEEKIKSFAEKEKEIPILSVKFEDLIKNPDQEARKVAKFLGVEYTQDKSSKIKDFLVPREKIGVEKKKAKTKRWLFHHLPKSIWKKIREC